MKKLLTLLAIAPLVLAVLASAIARAGDPKDEEVFPSFNSRAVVDGANLTWGNYLEWWNKTKGTPLRSEIELATNLWADGVARLQPQYVYTHGVNIVMVRSRQGEDEEGFYVILGIASSPGPKDEQFTRMFIAQHAGGSVFTFQRRGHFERGPTDKLKETTPAKATGSNAPPAKASRTFNARDYGAVGDDKTDNTEAFSTCLKAVVAAGGGRMHLPSGVYRGRILIPAVSKPMLSWITVEIVGEGEPTPVFGTIGSFPFQQNGTIIKSLSQSGPAVIAASSSPESLYGGFSAVNVVLKNLDVRTYDDPGIGGINLQFALQCKLKNVFINTGVYNVQASKPTHGTSGLVTPACNNAALTVLRNVVVTGYHTGIVVNEHTDGDNIVVASNVNGLEFLFAHHASRFARVGAYRNSNNVTVTGRHGFSIEQLNIERPGPGQTDATNAWQAAVSDVHDPGNLGVADINYWLVIGNVGASETFTQNGGATIQARRIGSSPAGNKRLPK